MDQQLIMYSLVQEWKESGLPKEKFVGQKSVSYHRFNYWLMDYNKHHNSDTNNVLLTFSVGASKVPSDINSNLYLTVLSG